MSQMSETTAESSSSYSSPHEPTKVVKARHKGRTNSKKMMSGEKAVIFEHIENHYSSLVGNRKSFDYCQERKQEWDSLVKAVNEVQNYKFK